MNNLKPLPKRVKIGGTIYEVRLTKGLKDPSSNQSLMGLIWATKPLIEIEAGMSLDMQWQVLWHELLHGFLHHVGFPAEHDESLIEALSTQINWVLIQNGNSMIPTK